MPHSIGYFAAKRQIVEEDQLLDSGAWGISFYRIAKGWGMLPEEYWEKSGEFDPNTPPPKSLDQVAKLFRLNHYQRLRSEPEVLYGILNDRAVTTALEISAAWDNAKDGVIPLSDSLPADRVHSIGYVGFDFDLNCFVFDNSWGAKWGKDGFGYLPFGYLGRAMIEGWTAAFNAPFVRPFFPGVRLTYQPGRESHIGNPFIVNIQNGDTNELLAWAHVVQRGSSFDVEELFVRPEFRRKGHGLELARKILSIAPDSSEVRFWIPWGDHTSNNEPRLVGWARRLGLRIQPSNVRWASFIATPGNPVDSLPTLDWIPSKATGARVIEGPVVDYGVAISSNEWTDELAARRAELIDLKLERALSSNEEAELQNLQDEFGKYQDAIAPYRFD